jgi:hypothetical protein
MARIRTPARPSSKEDNIKMVLGVDDLYDLNGGLVVIPEITLHVNPSDMDFQYKKLINRTRTRGGWYEEHWGDELDTIAVTASTGSFMDIRSGLSVEQRYQTLSMINFREIMSLFKNNACVYDDWGAIVSQGSVRIDYDNFKLYGQFSSFNFDEDDSQPYRFTFTFNFEVKKTVFGI